MWRHHFDETFMYLLVDIRFYGRLEIVFAFIVYKDQLLRYQFGFMLHIRSNTVLVYVRDACVHRAYVSVYVSDYSI